MAMHVELVSPERILYSGDAEMVICRTIGGGDIAFLADHAPFLGAPVDAVDFDVRRGESFGFLGPNGAGKSSTMRMIGCVSPVTEGVLRVLDMDPAADGPRIRARLGVVPQEDNLDVELTVRENLLIYGRYFDLPRPVVRERSDRILQFVQLDPRANEHGA